MNLRVFLPEGFPKIICLVGSTRFSAAFQKANLEETLAGAVILSVGSMTHSDAHIKACIYCGLTREALVTDLCTAHLDAVNSGNGHEFHPLDSKHHIGTKGKLDTLHFRKIEMADECLILNVKRSRGNCGCTEPGGPPDECVHGYPMVPYIGNSTRSEIRHALKLHKHLRFLNPQGRAGTTLLHADFADDDIESTMQMLGLA